MRPQHITFKSHTKRRSYVFYLLPVLRTLYRPTTIVNKIPPQQLSKQKRNQFILLKLSNWVFFTKIDLIKHIIQARIHAYREKPWTRCVKRSSKTENGLSAQ